MAKQTGRSLQLSAQGRHKADIALQKFAGKRDLAANLGMSPTTVTNFFAGRPVKRREFHEICKKLKLNWQEVADLPPITESESSEKLQDNDSDINELVREVRSRCCDKIQDQYSKIQLLNLQRIDVHRLYVDVYVLEKLCSESYTTIPDLLKGSDLRDGFDRLGLGKREQRSPGFEVAAQYRRLMILGKPGSGKSTFLRHLAVACCKGEFQAERIPILIELRDIKDATRFDLLNKIHKEFGLANQAQTEQILNQGKVLILLDGLDEVPGQLRRDVQDHIYEFSQQYYKNRFILTCRTQTTEYTLSTFDYVEVAEFKPEQVEIFAQNWFTALAETPEQGAELTVKFLGKLRLPENKQTAELAVTPILLSLTCWVFDDLKDLPPKRSDLYEQGINLLLEKWDEKRGVRRDLGSEAYRKLSIGEKKKLLSYLAARKFEQEQYVLFEQGELQGYIAEYLEISTEDSEAVLDAVAAQHGLLIERAQGFWSFSHLTFQEYFTAKWFCDRADWHGFVEHITDKHWREVFLLTVGMLPNPDFLLQLMKRQVDAFIATDEMLQKFLKWVADKSSQIQGEVTYKLAAVRAFYFALEFESGYRLIESSFASALESSFLFSYELESSRLERLPLSDLPFALDYKLIRIFHDKDCRIIRVAIDELIDNLPLKPFSYPGSDLKLKESLEGLRNKIPDYGWFDLNEETEKELWDSYESKNWKNELRDVINLHCNIGRNWQFIEEQKQLLQQYYYANNLLVNCMNSNVSDRVKEEIEEKLLLPFDVIEKS